MHLTKTDYLISAGTEMSQIGFLRFLRLGSSNIQDVLKKKQTNAVNVFHDKKMPIIR